MRNDRSALTPPTRARKGARFGGGIWSGFSAGRVSSDLEIPPLPISSRTPRQTEIWHPDVGKLFHQRSSDGSYPREITERIPRRSATDVHSDPESFDPLRQLPDVEIDQETNRAAGELEV